MENKALIWFRNDLRLHDNEALHAAYDNYDKVVPVYVFDDRIYRGQTEYGFAKTGHHRAKFLIESVQNLRDNLRSRGGDLVVASGRAEDVILALAEQYQATAVYCNRERTQEEVERQDAVEQGLWSQGKELIYTRGKMLYHTADLPFPIAQTPDIFSTYRKEVEKYVPVRKPLDIPASIKSKTPQGLTATDIPTLADLGHTQGSQADIRFEGGETAGLEQLDYYLWQSDLIATYKETRNGMLGWDFSSKLSPWLAAGCISPKQIYWSLKEYEEQRTKNRSTYWLFFELLWRDFFRLMGKKHGNAIFQSEGTKQEPIDQEWTEDRSVFRIWSEARTGVPLIDANMREINATGFMSNRGRQNVASFLVKDLKVHWLLGAEYFESMLLDYDPCSNYGNWNYVAGVGSDPRENRYFNPLSQSRKYDSDGTYVKHWLPEIKDLPSTYVHRPWVLRSEELAKYGVTLGKDYPKPAVPTRRW